MGTIDIRWGTYKYNSTMGLKLRKTGNLLFGRVARNVIFWLLFTLYHSSSKDNFLQSYLILLPTLLVSYGIPGYINNFWLAPQYLVKRRYGMYLLLFSILLALTTVESYYITHFVNDTWPFVNYMGDLQDVAMGYHAFPSMLMFALLAMGKFTSDAITNQHKLEELETQKLTSELESLKSQINPHFIFNALNTIYGLARRSRPSTSEAVIKLSDILRYVLYDCDVERIEVEKETQFLTQYVEFARLRSRSNATIELSIDARPGDYKVAPLLLLPLVENAIKHGLAKQIRNPWVKVELKVRDNKLYFDCANSNFNREKMALNTSSGIGLKNVKRRLELIYPGKYNLQIEDDDSQYRVKLSLDIV